ncbi:uncharacterized protein L969DRAFT_91307 [Mixia osmundae IAM 14324]|uniref:Uncharacterized protein n=1 Tax=Mixia osmundae (strain CBS 9802 / IAM 14324 / JCM 22182 / KY 12970) TaxID=764103 RepID=G7DST4_MIXOS|nr:uncharacterized protein L969DRAFT_91307 [Mixia osmundae IAM 14324]KEI41826.1 hypothetical protein L969DRAFT_91307 [Mixia osmundae IAM 14324]GAA93642.1 hypothetical protein E5Q_00286 [Mixia osmundae IAM 14324]
MATEPYTTRAPKHAGLHPTTASNQDMADIVRDSDTEPYMARKIGAGNGVAMYQPHKPRTLVRDNAYIYKEFDTQHDHEDPRCKECRTSDLSPSAGKSALVGSIGRPFKKVFAQYACRSLTARGDKLRSSTRRTFPDRTSELAAMYGLGFQVVVLLICLVVSCMTRACKIWRRINCPAESTASGIRS